MFIQFKSVPILLLQLDLGLAEQFPLPQHPDSLLFTGKRVLPTSPIAEKTVSVFAKIQCH